MARPSLAVAMGLLLAVGCGSSERSATQEAATVEQDTEAARQLFQTTCRTCHSLSDAKAAGVLGPDLDLLQPDAERVRNQISDGCGGMPADLLEGDSADLVARYVAGVAGQADPGGTGADGLMAPERRDGTKPRP